MSATSMERKIARKVSAHFDIGYMQALQCYRDTTNLHGFNERVKVKKATGQSYAKAAFEIVISNWIFD